MRSRRKVRISCPIVDQCHSAWGRRQPETVEILNDRKICVF